MLKKQTTRDLVVGSVIAALYVALTFLSNLVGLASGAVQVRLSEALCILPCFTPAAIPGLFFGCLIGNLVTGSMLPDIVFGSLATLIGALGTHFLRKNRYLAVLPPVFTNALIIPPVLLWCYRLEDSFLFLFATVGTGELISAGFLGVLLHSMINRRPEIKKLLSK